jgi:class 3 adenylate cyclase
MVQGMDVRTGDTSGRGPVAGLRQRLRAAASTPHRRWTAAPRWTAVRRWTAARPRSVKDVAWHGPRTASVLHSDMVGSTRLLEIAGPRYPRLLARHRALIAAAVTARRGRFLAHAGDGTLAVFDRAGDALAAAVAAQQALVAEPWPDELVPRVRMGLHTGEVYDVGGEPVGLAVNHGARVMTAAVAGQVMVSPAAAAALGLSGGAVEVGGIVVAEAGWHTLRDHATPVRLRQVVADGLTVVPPIGPPDREVDGSPVLRPDRLVGGSPVLRPDRRPVGPLVAAPGGRVALALPAPAPA